VITVSFLPIFALGARAPPLQALAYTKTFAMAAASLLAITLVPIMMLAFLRGKIRRNPGTPSTGWPRPSIIRSWRGAAVSQAGHLRGGAPGGGHGDPLLPAGLRIHAAHQRRRPVVYAHHHAGISITQAKNLLQQTDRIIRTFPEVENVFGKVGRAETATDPAP